MHRLPTASHGEPERFRSRVEPFACAVFFVVATVRRFPEHRVIGGWPMVWLSVEARRRANSDASRARCRSVSFEGIENRWDDSINIPTAQRDHKISRLNDVGDVICRLLPVRYESNQI